MDPKRSVCLFYSFLPDVSGHVIWGPLSVSMEMPSLVEIRPQCLPSLGAGKDRRWCGEGGERWRFFPNAAFEV